MTVLIFYLTKGMHEQKHISFLTITSSKNVHTTLKKKSYFSFLLKRAVFVNQKG